MKTKTVSLMLALLLVASALIGCTGGSPSEESPKESEIESVSESESEEETEESTTEPETETETLELVSVSVMRLPKKIEFENGEEFNAEGLVLSAKYSNDTFGRITEGYAVEAPDMSGAGVKEVTVTFEGKTVTYEITVLPAPTKDVAIGDRVTIGGDTYLVIDKEGTKSLVIAEVPLLTRAYHAHSGARWADSALREYLNSDFLARFSREEKDRILKTTVETPNNPESGIAGGPVSEDYVFLLSGQEAEQYFPTAESRKTTFNGAPSLWWLRTAAKGANMMVYVTANGEIYYKGVATSDVKGVRPAMWVVL